jgi:uncharacterized membrane protein
MRRLAPLVLLLSACGGSRDAPAPQPEPANSNNTAAAADPAVPAAAPSAQPKAAAGARWDLQASGEGSALALLSASGATAMRLFCPAGGKTLLVNVPNFRPIGSEERLSVGSGGAVAALVADPRGDRRRGGVSGSGAVPADLAQILAGPVSASYGAQVSGPNSPPPPEFARAFLSACRGQAAQAPAPKPAAANPCHLQGDARLAARPLRAVGTEPFWAAAINGRCVTYSHPDDQKGTRIWAHYTAGPGGGGTWSGAYEGKAFELRIRPAPGCSDGMSDRRYPLAAELLVGGEWRRGCAAPS